MGIKRKESKGAAVIMIIMTAAAIISCAIAAPLLCRQFYYAHIHSLHLTEVSGMTEEEIREAFDEVMDFCLGRSDVFSVGRLSWSQDGAAHFADVRSLFVIDIRIAVISCCVLAMTYAFCRWRDIEPYRFRGHSPGFWSASGLGTLMIIVGALACVDFDKAFEVFHKVFFPGRDNWIFDEYADPVILILPQEFFRNCAILILMIIILLCIALIAVDYVILYKNRRLRKQKCI